MNTQKNLPMNGESSLFKRGAVPAGDRHHPRHAPRPTREDESVRRPLPEIASNHSWRGNTRVPRAIMIMLPCRLPRE
ncbi:hypothetical protein CEXT_540991 [Caerostris extrusa]|uniref:Uncharacterized protein n=1 Tax=Caerostris extrusa TaxID=172846 RepID=A0AAV4YDG1_CAEEX|nr:hypothetical protein CEXT_540991 [Caerostris extrusa]